MHMAQVETWIRERAYSIWEQEGRPEGRERHHWEQAAREIMASGSGSSAYRSAKAGKPVEKTAASKGRNGKGRRPAA